MPESEPTVFVVDDENAVRDALTCLLETVATRRASLTAREKEVMALMVKCLPSKQIAAQLGITQKTVEVHRKHVLDKMGARSTPSLVRIVTAAGLSI